MPSPLPFAQLTASGCPTHAELALSLAAEFHPVPARAVEHELDQLAGPVRGAAHGAPLDALAAVCGHVGGELEPASALTTVDDLLLDRVLFNRAGHELAVAVACVEVGRRCGVRLGVVGGPGGCFVAHCDEEAPVLADLARGGALIDVDEVEGRIGWLCSHQVAGKVLGQVLARAGRCAHPAWTLKACTLRLALPHDPTTRRRVVEEHRHALSRMN